ncbi:MAG: hypothetical protein WBZ48_13615 [Bacteroidota bacterium]
MRITRIMQFLEAAILTLALLHQAAAQSISVFPVVTQADIINATALVDPLTEQVKNIAPTSFSMRIVDNRAPDTAWVTMHVQAFIMLDQDGPPAKLIATADIFEKNPGNNIHTPFPILPGAGRLFTSLDAQQGGSTDIDNNATVDDALKQRLKNMIEDPASGGKVPSGVYSVKITFTVVRYGNHTVNETLDLSNDPRFTVTVTNPTNATLLQPSDNGVEFPSPFPQFQWAYDTHGVLITVYEKRPEQQSLEDAISASDPYFQVQIDRQLSGNLTTLTYPQAPVGGPGITILKGPRPLERGKSYVVVLDGLRTAFGYSIDPLRTIRLFRISDPQGELVMNMLQSALSGGTFQNFMNLIQDQKLVLNSSQITLNGVSLSAQELQMILNQNKNNIKSIRFEN